MQLLRERNPISTFRVCLLSIHTKPLQLYKQHDGPFLNHHLTCSDLFGAASLTEELFLKIQKLSSTKLLQAVPERHIRLNVNWQMHKRLFPHARTFTSLALGDIYLFPLEHLLHPRFKLRHYFLIDHLV